jgi:hypothetical protein
MYFSSDSMGIVPNIFDFIFDVVAEDAHHYNLSSYGVKQLIVR